MEGRLYREDLEARRPLRLLSQTQESGCPSPPPRRSPSPFSTDTDSGFFRKMPVGSSAVGDCSSGGFSAGRQD